MRYGENEWTKAVHLRTKTGKKIALRDMVASDIKDLDDSKQPLLFGEPKSAELILLALSSDSYPVVIEKSARQLRALLGDSRTTASNSKEQS